jgi:hypothetical protein
MTDKEKLKGIKDALREIIAYPKKGVDARRTKDGFPSEIIYDDFAYKRVVRSYRSALKNVLSKYR